MDQLAVEALAAVVGFSDLLKKEPRRITAGDAEEAERLPRAIRRAAVAFFASDDFKASPPRLDKPSYSTITEQLNEEHAPRHIEAVHSAFHDRHQLADAYVVIAERAVAFLQAALPVRSIQTMSGLRELQPSTQELSRFYRQWTALNRPMVIMEQLAAGAVSSHAVHAVATIYPNLYAAMVAALQEALLARKTEKPSFTMSGQKDHTLQSFMRMDLASPELAKQLQQAFAEENQKQQPPGADVTKPSKAAESLQTPTTRAEQR